MALRKRITALALTGAAVLGLGVATAGPAAAIYRVDTSTCNAHDDFFTLWNYPPKVCFAENGAVNVAIYEVYRVDSGNNSGYFSGSASGSTFGVYFSAFKQYGGQGTSTVSYINITGR
ncbi:beta/gamma crystallin domain-containing protein [Kitasatospora sp. NPDC059795]|uniref:beta/gamma crystallin domain-containing protein n=1 Tax=Kitasatospora sp. NPDC059795 TaxID=3346949 RepID=UPI003651495F